MPLHATHKDARRIVMSDGIEIEVFEFGKGRETLIAGKTYGNRVVRAASQDKPDRVLSIILMGAAAKIWCG